MLKNIGQRVRKGHRAILRSRVGLSLATMLVCRAILATESDPVILPSSILDHPMLEADFLPSDLPVLLVLTPLDPTDTPLPTIRPLPEDSPEPLPQQPGNPAPKFSLTAPSLFVQQRNPSIPAPDDIPEEPPPGYQTPAPALIGEDAAAPAQPLAPQATTFARPLLNPPATVPPEILGVPGPILNAGLGLGEELTPYAQVQLARRYSFQLRAALSGIYDSASLVSVTGNKDDFILALVPEFAFTAGTDQSHAAIRLAYAPALTWYTQRTNKNGVDQNIRLDSRYKTSKFLLGLSVSAATSTSGGTLDTGQTSESQTYLAALTSSYQFTGKISADATLDDTLLKYSGFNNSNEIRLQGFGNYQLGKFKLGAGALLGLLDTQNEASQQYIQPLGRVIYTGDKLTLTASGGYEFRDLGENNGHSTNPVYQVAGSYLLMAHTMLLMDVQRHVFASVSSGGQTYVLTSFNGTLRQGFTGYGRNLFVSLAGGLQNNNYSEGTGVNAQPAGQDDYFYIRLACDWAFRERCLLGGFYEYSEESAGRPGTIGFTRSRVGIQLTLIFF